MGITKISVRGARQHNLKNIDVEIPRNTLTVITGLSGSGKSSLAFDTIYAEGQRRYVETLSAYARQFLDQMERPDVDAIDGLSPAISIEQKTTSRSPRSTVGTITEIYDYLRLLFASIGAPHCPKCGRAIARQTAEQIVQRVMALTPEDRVMVMAPIVRGRKGEFKKEMEKLVEHGFTRARIDGELVSLEDEIALDKRKNHTIEVVVDRLLVKPGIEHRLELSIGLAMKLAGGLVQVAVVGGEEQLYSEKLACPDCGINVPQLEPRSFSFNSAYGACPECHGLGSRYDFDPAKVIVDWSHRQRRGDLHRIPALGLLQIVCERLPDRRRPWPGRCPPPCKRWRRTASGGRCPSAAIAIADLRMTAQCARWRCLPQSLCHLCWPIQCRNCGMAWRIGIDIGGTFTDVALVEEDTGRIAIAKLLTTPHDFGQAVIDGIRQGLDANRIDPADVSLLSHATTVVTNALLENKGARAGFVATRGMRDILELRRSSRADLYDLLQDAPAVLVPRRWRFEITERIDAQGEVVTPLAEDELPALIEAIRDAGLQTVAVSFLFSFLNDAHERRVGEALRAALPDVAVYLSSEVLPEIREFERASTTAVCAVVGPVLASYLDRLQSAIIAARAAEAARDGLVRRRVRHRRRAAHAGDGGGIRSRPPA